ncbi:MAG: DUF951 family protein, partial [Acetatifactor sp.]|nr:DUF951 family protein [Acetatifactor sp.]
KCMGCGHQIMIARKLLEKNVREIKEKLENVGVLCYYSYS